MNDYLSTFELLEKKHRAQGVRQSDLTGWATTDMRGSGSAQQSNRDRYVTKRREEAYEMYKRDQESQGKTAVDYRHLSAEAREGLADRYRPELSSSARSNMERNAEKSAERQRKDEAREAIDEVVQSQRIKSEEQGIAWAPHHAQKAREEYLESKDKVEGQKTADREQVANEGEESLTQSKVVDTNEVTDYTPAPAKAVSGGGGAETPHVDTRLPDPSTTPNHVLQSDGTVYYQGPVVAI